MPANSPSFSFTCYFYLQRKSMRKKSASIIEVENLIKQLFYSRLLGQLDALASLLICHLTFKRNLRGIITSKLTWFYMQYSVFWIHLSVPQWDVGENITWPSRWVLQAPSPCGGGGGHLTHVWVEGCGWGSETLTLFRTKVDLKYLPCLGKYPPFYISV